MGCSFNVDLLICLPQLHKLNHTAFYILDLLEEQVDKLYPKLKFYLPYMQEDNLPEWPIFLGVSRAWGSAHIQAYTSTELPQALVCF